jgi:hypothetical protein
LAAHRVPYPDVLCLASLSFSAARRWPVELLARRARRCVPASVGRCIPPGQHPRERVPSVWDLLFRLPEPRGPVLVPAVLRGGPVSAMFRVA